MSFTKACCTLPPVESNYIPQGKLITVNDLPIYETGDENSNRLLICAYDIFGFHPVTKQFCDKLGLSGFRVVMPDFFRGTPLSSAEFEKGREEIMKFVTRSGSWEKTVQSDVIKTIEYYKAIGVNAFGMFGLCWGAKMSVLASIEGLVQAAVLIHPSMVETEEADRVKCPILSLPTRTDADMVPFYEKIKARFGEEGSGHRRFDDMEHGFCGSRGNLDDELNRTRVDEALALTHNFFSKNLKQ